jgi:single-strand DNA-binding protein
MYFNKVILVGNLTRNPEVRVIPGKGTPVANFGIAINRRFKAGENVKEETCFVDVIAFSKLAEFVGGYTAKGMTILVEGRLSYRTWEQDGQKRSKHEIVAENIQLLWKKDTQSNEVEEPDFEDDVDILQEDIPF